MNIAGITIDLLSAIAIVLLIIDIFGRFNSTYWFRKGFESGMKILTDVLTKK